IGVLTSAGGPLSGSRCSAYPGLVPDSTVWVESPSERHLIRRALRSLEPTLVVNLCGRDVSMPQKILNFTDVHPGIEQQGRRGRPQRVRCLDAVCGFWSSPAEPFLAGG